MFARTFKSTPSISFATALLGAVALSSTAFAGPADDGKDAKKQVMEQAAPDPKWYISLGGDTDFDIHATYQLNNAAGSVFGLPATVESRSFGATHDQPYSAHLELGYVVAPNWELFGTVYYDGAQGDNDRIGYVTDTFGAFGPAGEKHRLYGELDDYNSAGIEFGVRYFFLPKTSKIRPFLSLSVGGRYIDSQSLRLSARGIGDVSVGFYDDTFALSASGLLGVEYSVTKCFSIGVESGIAYQYEQTERDEKLVPNSARYAIAGIAGLQSTNDDGDRLYIPVAVYGKLRF